MRDGWMIGGKKCMQQGKGERVLLFANYSSNNNKKKKKHLYKYI